MLNDIALIKSCLEQAVKLPIYFQKGKLTYCNILAKDILDSHFDDINPYNMGYLIGKNSRAVIKTTWNYDISPYNLGTNNMRQLMLNTPIQTGYLFLKEAAGKEIDVIPAKEAHRRANQDGIVIHIVSSKYNHEAIIYPDGKPFNEKFGFPIAQAGAKNGVMMISDPWSFGANWNDPEILYINYRQL